jgi:hypothetical protein
MWLLIICLIEKWSGFNWKKAGSVLNAQSVVHALMRFSAAGLIDTSQRPEEAVRFEQADLALLCPGFLRSGRAVSRSKPPFGRPVISRNITVLRLRLLVDCQGKSTLQVIHHTAIFLFFCRFNHQNECRLNFLNPIL